MDLTAFLVEPSKIIQAFLKTVLDFSPQPIMLGTEQMFVFITHVLNEDAHLKLNNILQGLFLCLFLKTVLWKRSLSN